MNTPYSPQSRMSYESTPQVDKFVGDHRVNEYVNAAYDTYDHSVSPVNMPPEQRTALGAAAHQSSPENSPVIATQPVRPEQINNAEVYQLAVIGNNIARARDDKLRSAA